MAAPPPDQQAAAAPRAVWAGRATTWSRAPPALAESSLRFDRSADRRSCSASTWPATRSLLARRDRLDALIAEQAGRRAVGASRRAAALPARRRHPDRGRPRRRDRRLRRVRASPSSWPATSASSRPSSPRRRAAGRARSPRPAQPRPPAADRGRLALPPPTARVAHAAPPPARPAAGRDRRRLARAAAAAPPLDAPRRRARQETHHRRGRRRPRARLLCLGDRPPARLTAAPTTRSRWGWRPARATRDPRCAL